MRNLNVAVGHCSNLAKTPEGLEDLRGLGFRDLSVIPPFALWAFVIQELCKEAAVLKAHDPTTFFSARHMLTKGPQLPKWQTNPAFDKYMSRDVGPTALDPEMTYKVELLLEYSKCLFDATTVLRSFIQVDLYWEYGPCTPTTPSSPSNYEWDPSSPTANEPTSSGPSSAAILNSAGLLIFEAFISTFETSYLLQDQMPWATDQLMTVALVGMTKSGLAREYSVRLREVIDRMEGFANGREASRSEELSKSGGLGASTANFVPAPTTPHRPSVRPHPGMTIPRKSNARTPPQPAAMETRRF